MRGATALSSREDQAMNVPNYDRGRMVHDISYTTTWGVIAAVVAVSIVVVAIFAYNKSKGSDTSGDDTRAVVNNGPAEADINTIIPAAPSIPSTSSPATSSPQP
jgi:hypothetical protein